MDERTDDLNAYRDPEDPVIIRPHPEAAPEMNPAGPGAGYRRAREAPTELDDEALADEDAQEDAQGDEAFAGDDETETVRDNIEQTRSEMSQTIDAIQARLDPQRLKEQAKETVRDATVGKVQNVVNDMQESARGMGDTILETIRQNPLPAALVGLGLGWLVVKGRQSARANSYPYRPLGQASPSSSYRIPVEGYETDTQSGVRQAAGTAQQKAGQLADSAQRTAGAVADQMQSKASDLAGSARDTMQQAGQQVQAQAQQVQGTFQRVLRENPLALGAVALALGAAVGLAIPETQQEHQLLGPARDTLVDRTQDAAQDTVQRVQSVVSTAKDAAQQEAQRQGLAQGNTEGNASPPQRENPATKGGRIPRDNTPSPQTSDPSASI